ncbi:MAG: ATP-binding protein [Pseudobdellovibrionaceae bacterium]
MFHRILNPLKSQSFFIFGARGTGKSTFVRTQFNEGTYTINLLEETFFLRYSRNADQLIADLKTVDPKWTVVIDEIQKVPRLLDTVHHLIETDGRKFILTGSSARKLKRGAANLLAGRAFQYNLFPLTYRELGSSFNLDQVLRWGSLPKIFSLSDNERDEFLRSYAQTYLKEEILEEQLVRNGISFRNYLEVAALENGKTINFTKISRDIDVDPKTTQNYFQILEDTLIGFFLPGFHQSVRKSVKQQPKFYLFDLGIKRALAQELRSEIGPRSSAYGHAFEHFIICEIYRLNSYYRADFSLYHYQTTSGGEIDLVMKRGREIIAIEIKSSTAIDLTEVSKLKRIAPDIKATKAYYLSQDPVESIMNNVHCIFWRDFLDLIFKF